MPNEELNSLPYVSSAPDLIQDDEPHPQDEAELSTMGSVLKLIKDQTKLYKSIDSLSLDPAVLSVFSVEEQLAINAKVVLNLQTIERKITVAINKVKEKQDGRTF